MKNGEDYAKSIRDISERGFHEKSWEIALAEIQISEPSIRSWDVSSAKCSDFLIGVSSSRGKLRADESSEPWFQSEFQADLVGRWTNQEKQGGLFF